MGALIVARGDRFEALLARSVPDLQLADFVVAVDSANFEVNTDRGHEVLLELVVLKRGIAQRNSQHTMHRFLRSSALEAARLLTANLRRR